MTIATSAAITGTVTSAQRGSFDVRGCGSSLAAAAAISTPPAVHAIPHETGTACPCANESAKMPSPIDVITHEATSA